MAELEKLYYINVGKEGTFKPSGNQQYDTTAKDVDILFDHLKANNQKKIVVYFHGGLVGASGGMNTASRIKRYVKERTTSHPVAFVWETGPVETILQNLEPLSNQQLVLILLHGMVYCQRYVFGALIYRHHNLCLRFQANPK